MQILDVYTKKEYKCKKCNNPIYYGKIADDNGKLYTEDGKDPNGKFGRESNVISGAVDINVKDRLHGCSAHFVEEKIAGIGQSKSVGSFKTLWDVIDDKSPDMQELLDGLNVMKSLAYEYVKINNPELDDQSDIFKRIVNAETTHLIDLAKVRAIKEGGLSVES